MLEKRHVTMKSVAISPTDPNVLLTHEAHDYVPVDDLAAYVDDARTRWQSVEVEDGHNPGPGGDEETN